MPYDGERSADQSREQLNGTVHWVRQGGRSSMWWPAVIFVDWAAMEQYGIPPPPASVGSENRSLPTVGKKQVVACFLGPELTYGVVKFSEAHVRLFLAEDGAPPRSNSPAGGLVAKTSAVAKHKWREDLEFAIAEAIEYVTAEDDEDEDNSTVMLDKVVLEDDHRHGIEEDGKRSWSEIYSKPDATQTFVSSPMRKALHRQEKCFEGISQHSKASSPTKTVRSGHSAFEFAKCAKVNCSSGGSSSSSSSSSNDNDNDNDNDNNTKMSI